MILSARIKHHHKIWSSKLVHLSGNVTDMMTSGFSKLTERQQEQLLIHLFQKLLVKLNPGLDAKFVLKIFSHS
jgi:hypothetical protein